MELLHTEPWWNLVPIAAWRAVAWIGLATALGAMALGASKAAWRKPAMMAGAIGAALHLAGVVGSWAGPQYAWMPLERAALAGAALVLSIVWARRPVAAAPYLLASFLLAATGIALSIGHMTETTRTAWALDVIHVTAATTWVGALGGLGFLLRKPTTFIGGNEAIGKTLARFGTLATVAVAMLTMTGVVVAASLLGNQTLHVDAWTGSPWGRTMIIKVALVAVMIGVAWRNRVLVRQQPGSPSLVRGILLEWLLGLAVICLAALAGVQEGPSLLPNHHAP